MTKAYLVERVLIGNGAKARNGATLDENRLYASSVCFGGPESFFAIIKSSLKLTVHNQKGHKYLTCLIDKQACVEMWQEVSFDISDSMTRVQRERELKRQVMDYLKTFPGMMLLIGGPGDRTKSKNATKFWNTTYGELAYIDGSGGCIKGSVINAVSCKKSYDIAKRMETIINRENRVYTKVSQCARTIHKLNEKMELKKMRSSSYNVFKIDPVFFFRHLTCGVFIMRIQQSQRRSHYVAVDCNRQLILDSVERFPMTLSLESLLISAGSPKNNHISYVDVHELVDQK